MTEIESLRQQVAALRDFIRNTKLFPLYQHEARREQVLADTAATALAHDKQVAAESWKDAQRYRWLLNAATYQYGEQLRLKESISPIAYGKTSNEAIDAAIAQTRAIGPVDILDETRELNVGTK